MVAPEVGDMGSMDHGAFEVRRLRSGLRRSLEALRSMAEDEQPGAARLVPALADLVGAADAQLAASPDERAIADAEALVAELVECVSGLAVLGHGLGARTVPAAQRWLDDLSVRARLPAIGLVVPSALEFYGARADIVRLRVPDDGIWGLPVAVHEYGHFLATRLRSRRIAADGLPETGQVVEDLLLRAARDAARPVLYRMGHELFADALAVLVAGPAYAWYVFRHRFLPDRPRPDLHPSWQRRAQVVRASLERLASGTGDPGLRTTATQAAEAWEHGDPAADDGLDDLAAEVVAITFDDTELARIRYRSHTPTAMAVARLQAPPGALPTLDGATDVAAVVNAAWLVRFGLERSASDLDDLDQRLSVVEERAFHELLVPA